MSNETSSTIIEDLEFNTEEVGDGNFGLIADGTFAITITGARREKHERWDEDVLNVDVVLEDGRTHTEAFHMWSEREGKRKMAKGQFSRMWKATGLGDSVPVPLDLGLLMGRKLVGDLIIYTSPSGYKSNQFEKYGPSGSKSESAWQ